MKYKSLREGIKKSMEISINGGGGIKPVPKVWKLPYFFFLFF